MSMTLFKLHFIVIFMYTSLFMIVLFKIPYKYDRIEKTHKEKCVEKKRRSKVRAKKRRRQQKLNPNHELVTKNLMEEPVCNPAGR